MIKRERLGNVAVDTEAAIDDELLASQALQAVVTANAQADTAKAAPKAKVGDSAIDPEVGTISDDLAERRAAEDAKANESGFDGSGGDSTGAESGAGNAITSNSLHIQNTTDLNKRYADKYPLDEVLNVQSFEEYQLRLRCVNTGPATMEELAFYALHYLQFEQTNPTVVPRDAAQWPILEKKSHSDKTILKYEGYRKRWKKWCDYHAVHPLEVKDENGRPVSILIDDDVVTEPKLLLYIHYEVLGTAPRRDKRNTIGSSGSVGIQTVDGNVSAMKDLFDDQRALALRGNYGEIDVRFNGEPRGKLAAQYLRQKKTHDIAWVRETENDRSRTTASEGYNYDDFLRICKSALRDAKEDHFIIRDWYMLVTQHFSLLRGDAGRKLELSDLVSHVVSRESPTPFTVLYIMSQDGRLKEGGRAVDSAVVRNIDPHLCPVGSLAFWLIYRWDCSGSRSGADAARKKRGSRKGARRHRKYEDGGLGTGSIDSTVESIMEEDEDQVDDKWPDFLNRSWYGLKVAPSTNSYTDAHRRQDMPEASQNKQFQRLYDRAKVNVSGKVTHVRKSGARHLAILGGTDAEVQRLGKWNANMASVAYCRDVPLDAVRLFAGFTRDVMTYSLPRAFHDPPPDLRRMIFPELESTLDRVRAQNETCHEDEQDLLAEAFLELLDWLRDVAIQDAAILKQEFPNFPVFELPAFQSAAFVEYQKRVLEDVKHSGDTTDVSAQMAAFDAHDELLSGLKTNGFWSLDQNKGVINRYLAKKFHDNLVDGDWLDVDIAKKLLPRLHQFLISRGVDIAPELEAAHMMLTEGQVQGEAERDVDFEGVKRRRHE